MVTGCIILGNELFANTQRLDTLVAINPRSFCVCADIATMRACDQHNPMMKVITIVLLIIITCGGDGDFTFMYAIVTSTTLYTLLWSVHIM